MHSNDKLPPFFTHKPNTSRWIVFQKQLFRDDQTNSFYGSFQEKKRPQSNSFIVNLEATGRQTT